MTISGDAPAFDPTTERVVFGSDAVFSFSPRPLPADQRLAPEFLILPF
jgi:hypothetical protein